jgi:competence ComEA-like helix-hairpin-helix protein
VPFLTSDVRRPTSEAVECVKIVITGAKRCEHVGSPKQYFRVPTSNEKKALWFLATVALSGSGVQLWRARTPDSSVPESAALQRQIGRVDSVRALRHTRNTKSRKAEPLKVDSATSPAGGVSPQPAPIDLDYASTDQIESLPGIGPALARRIVAHRDSAGAFAELSALCEVRGIGPALVERLRPLVTFTGPRRPLSAACGDASNKAPKTRAARARQLR